jgi:Zn-dependent M28 family amino/carboxypeptidase
MIQAPTTRDNADVGTKTNQAYTKNTIASVWLITNTGIDMLIGRDGAEVREKIEQDNRNLLDYRFFDDDKRAWAYWAFMDVDGTIKPFSFPSPDQYGLTSPQLYTKAVTYPHILAHAVGLLKAKPSTLWDRMMKPTTIILAIVGIVFVMGIMLMALQG